MYTTGRYAEGRLSQAAPQAVGDLTLPTDRRGMGEGVDVMSHAGSTDPGLPHRGRAASAARREHTVERLEDLFLAEGFGHFTIDEISRRLRCSKSTLYAVAPSREQIVQTVTRHFFARATDAIEAAVACETDPARRILTYLSGVGGAMSRNSEAFYTDMVAYAPTAHIYQLNSDAAALRVRGLIEDAVDADVFRAGDAAFAANAVALLIDGIQSGRLLHDSGVTAGQAFEELGRLIVEGLAVRSYESSVPQD